MVVKARIDALISSARLANELAHQETNLASVYKSLHERLAEIVVLTEDFAWVRFPALPKSVFDVFERQGRLRVIARNQAEPHMRATVLLEGLVLLQAFAAEVTQLLNDGQLDLTSRTERAILHLQWTIAIDDTVRNRWQTAFRSSETACEALGAAHLLQHGIYAFKAHSRAARTDLVSHEPVDEVVAARAAEGLVLTEWKVAKSQVEADSKLRDAAIQSDAYAHGVLGGRELRSIRYLIAVTEKQITMPVDDIRDTYVYRHLNIAVAPVSPSKLAATLRS
ncbi:hypothetical protein BJF93_11245 [Xaviernesmea oryzae]|uniref:Uncharacterized protein n=1 Tax=Xaviernesmea oryzae TaxID=464029 RepID=A0A1Q9AW53_9HYPH|nr:hypothetical protein [Xaviernesmea oryzae]OLP59644.1 hypothetical protein BJF93_11245 [Xaviernesmea oryzae]SEM24211.1 hypothetical protein SAMN04487976_12430 [Xaviernesmea oryzae]